MMPQETFETVLDQLDQLVRLFETHPDEQVQGQVTALLTAVDMIHREGLTRLVRRLNEIGGEELVAEVAQDPVAEILLGLYGLVDLDLPEEETLPPPARSTDQILLQYGARARWLPVADTSDVPPGGMIGVEAEDVKALLVNVGGEFHCLRNACAGSDLPMEMGQLRGHQLVCPWHGCEYDARSGQRTDGGSGRIQVYPVALRGSSIELALQGPPIAPAPAANSGCGAGQCGCS